MSEKNTGGPAFSVPGLSGLPGGDCIEPYHGMTLRDYFAAKAVAAMIAHHGIYDEMQPLDHMTSATMHDYHAETVAMTAFVYADAMLKARAL
jgi:hypothetical protein